MKELKKYYHNIQRALPGSLCQKRKLMQDIQCAVSGYLQEHPEADMETITAHFGMPQQIADTYLAEMSPQKLHKQLNVKKWIIGIIAAAMACALLLWGIAVGIALVNEFEMADGYIETYPLVIEE